MTTQEVAKKYNVSLILVQQWAAKNNVKYIGEGRRKTYILTEDDCLLFEKRQRAGWVKGRPRKVK